MIKISQITGNFNKKKKEFDDLSIRFDESNIKIMEYEQKISNLAIELDRSSGQLKLRKKEVDELKSLLSERDFKIESLNEQISKLNAEIKNLQLLSGKERYYKFANIIY